MFSRDCFSNISYFHEGAINFISIFNRVFNGREFGSSRKLQADVVQIVGSEMKRIKNAADLQQLIQE